MYLPNDMMGTIDVFTLSGTLRIRMIKMTYRNITATDCKRDILLPLQLICCFDVVIVLLCVCQYSLLL